MYTLSLHDALPICFWCLSKGTFPRQAPSLDNVALMLPPLRNRFGVVVAGKESYAAYDGEGPLPGEDRKSTRLNSSHVSISYAVFCLKKKNETSSSRGKVSGEIAKTIDGLQR